MKIPDAFQSLLGKKNEKEPVYVSLYLDVHMVAVSVWHIVKGGTSRVIASAHLAVPSDTWEDRIESVDRLMGAMEQKTGRTDLTIAILGLPAVYLTPTGEIKKEIRADIKKLAQILELQLAGFVPLHQSIIFKLKTDEGVPPSVILLGINTKTIAISLYKIGALVGLRDLEKHADVAKGVEEGLKSFTEMEVLPARILLYGSEDKELDEVKNKLLHHPWTTRANFLHFPKIEIVTIDMIIDSISLAGASEMKKEAITPSESEEVEAIDESTVEAVAAVSAPADSPPEGEQEGDEDEEELEAQYEESPREMKSEQERILDGEVAQATQTLAEDFAVDKEVQDDANVVVVDAESLGFKKDADVLEEEQVAAEATRVHSGHSVPLSARVSGMGGQLGHVGSSVMEGVKGFLSSPKQKYVGIFFFLLIAGLVWAGFSWTIPRAVVTVYEIAQTIEADQTITIDPETTEVNEAEQSIPGLKRERSMDGEKTVPVKGKKSIGDPARGTVTIYNKSLSSRTFSKGTVIQSGSLKFTLDGDVQVASASESIGSITFGKANAAVTAQAIGAAGNLTVGSEFTFAEVSSSVATARNDTAFTGGTSRDVTVVSRADVDGLIAAVSEELTDKAQQELSGSVGGGEALIDGTIKTTVTARTFDKEIDQEASELNGKLTITVSGTAYSQADIRSLFERSGKLTAPQGYKMDEANTTITLSNVKIQKDGTITAQAHIKTIALPILDSAGLPKELAGKTLKEAETYLRSLSGVAGMEVSFRLSPSKNRLPLNKNNISVSVAIAQ